MISTAFPCFSSMVICKHSLCLVIILKKSLIYNVKRPSRKSQVTGWKTPVHFKNINHAIILHRNHPYIEFISYRTIMTEKNNVAPPFLDLSRYMTVPSSFSLTCDPYFSPQSHLSRPFTSSSLSIAKIFLPL